MAKKTKTGLSDELAALEGSNHLEAPIGEAFTCSFCKHYGGEGYKKLNDLCQEYADKKRQRLIRTSIPDFYQHVHHAYGVRIGQCAFRRHLKTCCKMGRLRRGTGT